ncbi:hypothetical protein [Streptomyces sp. NRRL S-350]|uniref:hypothetical protein n=1 Tax=Streptomyces sp. NRRL S-350 TaxID=1463902 RepID=UPI0004C0014C|nr:hypothetical protein [Streptomyces sp. NRRL S-350]
MTRTRNRTRPAPSTPKAATRSSPAVTQQDPSPPLPDTEAILADARQQADQVLAEAEASATGLLARAEATAAAHLATTARWTEEAKHLRAEADEAAERLTGAANLQADQILAEAQKKADQVLFEAKDAARIEREKSTAEAEAQADQLVEDATQRASELLAEATSAADTVRTQAAAEAASLVAEAERRARAAAETITEEADAQARRLLADAERAAKQATAKGADDLADLQGRIEAANRYLETVRSRTAEARAEADDLVADRRRQADEIHRTAVTAAETALTEAAQAAETIRTTAAETARQMVAEADAQANQARQDAEENRERLTEAARREADGIREEAAEAAQLLREEVAAEAHEIREEAAREAAEIRERGTEAVQRLREQAEATIAEELRKAAAARGRAESESERAINTAKREADRILADADNRVEEADRHVREAAAAVKALRQEQQRREAAEAARRQGKIRKAWRWGQEQVPAFLRTTVLVAGIAYTAQREHQLAAMSGVNDALAWLIAVCVDAWVLASARSKVHKEMAIALGVMATCQVAAILADFHLLGTTQNSDGQWRVHWAVAVPLALVVPVVIWRVHALMDHAKDGRGGAHGEQRPPAAPGGPLVDGPDAGHDDLPSRPQASVENLPNAQAVLLPAQAAHGERSHERAISAGEGPASAHPELPASAGGPVDAHGAQVMSDAALMLARKAAVRPLYDALQGRPTAKQIYATLFAKGLVTGTEESARNTCQRVRDAIETDEPHLKPVSAGRSR